MRGQVGMEAMGTDVAEIQASGGRPSACGDAAHPLPARGCWGVT